MSSCIFCGQEDILYIEQDVVSKKTGRFLHLDIRTNKIHNCLARAVLKEVFPGLPVRQLLNPDKVHLNEFPGTNGSE